MPLVKLQLRRHKRSEPGDYVTHENYADIAVSNKLPAHTYKDVPCCLNCFKVYAVITEAREKAIKKIERRQQRRGGHEEHKGGASGDIDADSVSASVSSLRTASSLGKSALHSSSSMFSPVKAGRAAAFSAPGGASVGAAGGGGGGSISTYIGKSEENESLRAAVEAIDSLTKLDVAEIRTMIKPPAAVEIVLEAVVALLTGKNMTFQETRRLLGGGEAFLVMLREFRLEDVTDARLRLVEPYADNPVFRPENVIGVSFCASKFCAWVLGVVQAARWQRGYGHKRTDSLRSDMELATVPEVNNRSLDYTPMSVGKGRLGGSLDESSVSSYEELTFVQKLERKKAMKSQDQRQTPSSVSRSKDKKSAYASASKLTPQKMSSLSPSMSTLPSVVSAQGSLGSTGSMGSIMQSPSSLSDMPGPPLLDGSGSVDTDSRKRKKAGNREQVAMAASQKKAADRLSSHNKTEGNLGAIGQPKEFRCADGITKIPYIVLGNVSLAVKRCNFIVVHDFFDTCDATAIMFKPLVQVHDGCQVICFNYPGQANTVWPRLPAAERERGAKEPILNNDWMADRLHELLLHAEQDLSLIHI